MILKQLSFLKRIDLKRINLKSINLKSIDLNQINFPQKKALWGVIAAVVVIMIYFFIVLPIVEAKKKAAEEITLKRKVLLRYDEYLKNRKTIEEDLDRTLKVYETVQQRLLSGETPQLGAANLQEIVKKLSEKNGIAIRSFRILEPKEMHVYRKISLHIEFNPVNSMLSLGQLIYDIENNEKELTISEMDLLVFNPRMPSNIQGSLVISGLMKAAKTKEKEKEG
jgi:type II secretory pathway component PulM